MTERAQPEVLEGVLERVSFASEETGWSAASR